MVCKCECLPRVICLPTDMKTRGKWGVTHGPTHASLWRLLLWWFEELIGFQVKCGSVSQTLTVNNLLLSVRHTKRGWLSPSPLFVISHLWIYFSDSVLFLSLDCLSNTKKRWGVIFKESCDYNSHSVEQPSRLPALKGDSITFAAGVIVK